MPTGIMTSESQVIIRKRHDMHWLKVSDSGQYSRSFQDAVWNLGASRYDEEDPGFDLHGFGTVSVEIGVLDSEIRSWFVYGNCVMFALVAADMIPGSTVSLVCHEAENILGNTWSHALVRLPDGSLIDGAGYRTEDGILNLFKGEHLENFDINTVAGEAAFLARIGHDIPLYDWDGTVYTDDVIEVAKYFIGMILDEAKAPLAA